MRTGVVGLLVAALALTACAPSSESGPREAASSTRLSGTLLEKLDAPPYSYLRLKTKTGEIWAAVPVTFVDKDRPITVLNGAALKNYSAGPIGRRFEVVYFGTLEQAR
jgi:hypothetical protein